MKKLNKMLSMLLAVIMVLGMSITAMADETYTITINNSEKEHTYAAYQIFSGTVSGDNALTDMDWGTGISDSGKTALSNAGEFAAKYGVDDGADLAKAVAPYLSATYESVAGNGSSAEIKDLAPGYYLVKDINSLKDKDAAYTSYILEVVKDVEVTPKASVPTLVKKVADDITDVTKLTNNDDAWQDSADYSKGDKVPFKLTATLPTNVSAYTKYTLKFNDELSEGLTFDGENSVAVTVVDKNNATYDLTADDYIVASNGTALTFTISDLKNISALSNVTLDEAQVIVRYTATLNENAKIGYEGNPNTANLEYSNNPNYTGTGDNGGETKDETPGGKDDDSTGKTTDDKVVVFTYELDVTKIDGEQKTRTELKGAKFALYTATEYAKVNHGTPIAELDGTDTAEFKFDRIDAGDYVLVETQAPEKYNTISPIKFTISAEHDSEKDDPKLTKLEVKDNTTASFTVGDDGTEGDYTKYTGVISTDVVNNQGTVLPTTGGMGTRVIYLIGGALVLAASVLLVTKRRMRNSK